VDDETNVVYNMQEDYYVSGCSDDEKKLCCSAFLETAGIVHVVVFHSTVLDNLKQTIEMAGCNAMQAVNAVCLANGIAEDFCSQIVNAAALSGFDQAFPHLATDWKRKQYYRQKLNCVEPKSVRYVMDDPTSAETLEFVSLINTLKLLIKNNEIMQQVLNPPAGKPQIISNLSDGSLFKNHPVYQAHGTALQIILYSDEFVVNPLGPNATKHKNLAFYFTIDNLSSNYKSYKDVIQFLALCNSNHIKKHGLKAVADVIFADVNILEQEGIELCNSTQKNYGSIAYIAGDNLNSHMIGGFNSSFGPKVYRPC
jgi:hypothetical protein